MSHLPFTASSLSDKIVNFLAKYIKRKQYIESIFPLFGINFIREVIARERVSLFDSIHVAILMSLSCDFFPLPLSLCHSLLFLSISPPHFSYSRLFLHLAASRQIITVSRPPAAARASPRDNHRTYTRNLYLRSGNPTERSDENACIYVPVRARGIPRAASGN